MVVRTIAQLPDADHNKIFANPTRSYVEVSVPSDANDGRYVSRKTNINEVNSVVYSDLSTQIVKDYNMNWSNGGRINLAYYVSRFQTAILSDFTFENRKILKEFPMCSADFPSEPYTKYGGTEDNIIPNVKKVNEIVKATPAFISTEKSMIAGGCPFKTFRGNQIDRSGKSICYRDFTSSDRFYYWKIADGNTDSADTIYDTTSSSQKHYVEIKDTGYLVVWGWITDGGTVPSDMAWVGLFAEMKYQGGEDDIVNIPLQIQPWVQGSKSNDMQYVGFGVPVRAGLRLNIRTGFAVAGGSNGGFQREGSMTFQDGWISNSFVGYVIRNQE